MKNEISVNKILLLYYNNIFRLALVFAVSFMLSYLFSDEILDKEYSSKSYLQMGEVEGKSLDTIGSLINKTESTSFNSILYENFDVPSNSSFKFSRSLEEQTHLTLFIKTQKAEDNLILQNIMQSMIRLIQKPIYDDYIKDINARIMRIEADLVRINIDIDRLDSNLYNVIDGEGSFPAMVAYLDIVEKKRAEKESNIRQIGALKSRIESATETSYITKAAEMDSSNFSFPNNKTHLGFGIFMLLLFNVYLVFKEFKK